jgi:hypothetical protein
MIAVIGKGGTVSSGSMCVASWAPRSQDSQKAWSEAVRWATTWCHRELPRTKPRFVKVCGDPIQVPNQVDYYLELLGGDNHQIECMRVGR